MFLTRKLLILLALVSSALDISCNRGEGPGGTGTIEGTVYKVLHPDDNYNLETDTVLAAKEDVFWVYGTQSFYGKMRSRLWFLKPSQCPKPTRYTGFRIRSKST